MECMLAAICFYLDVAIGAHRERDAHLDAHETGIHEFEGSDGKTHRNYYIRDYEVREATEIMKPNPLGRVKVGLESAGGWYFEIEHHSSITTGQDEGFNGAWLGRRFRF